MIQHNKNPEIIEDGLQRYKIIPSHSTIWIADMKNIQKLMKMFYP